MKTALPDKTSAEEWVKNLKKAADIRAQLVILDEYQDALGMLVQSGRDELSAAVGQDCKGAANLDVAQQVIVEIQNAITAIDEANKR